MFDKRRKYFCLTVDVEQDAGKEWKTSNPITFEGVYKGVARLQELCRRYGARPTYFLSPVVLKNQGCVSFFQTLKRSDCELGTHLHGDYIEPEARYKTEDFSGCDASDMQCEYTSELELGKLKSLTKLFIQKFGCQPSSFRAGRFAARGWTIHCLKNLGYTHDSSVTPFRNWYNKADFSRATELRPYYASADDILKKNNDGIIEVPISITPDKIWLRPSPGYSNLAKLIKVVGWYEKKFKDTTLCSMFHNVELVAGKSPYCAAEKDCKGMLDALAKLFEFLNKKRYKFLTIKEVTV